LERQIKTNKKTQPQNPKTPRNFDSLLHKINCLIRIYEVSKCGTKKNL